MTVCLFNEDWPHCPGSFKLPSFSAKSDPPNPDNSDEAQKSPARAPGKYRQDKSVDRFWP